MRDIKAMQYPIHLELSCNHELSATRYLKTLQPCCMFEPPVIGAFFNIRPSSRKNQGNLDHHQHTVVIVVYHFALGRWSGCTFLSSSNIISQSKASNLVVDETSTSSWREKGHSDWSETWSNHWQIWQSMILRYLLHTKTIPTWNVEINSDKLNLNWYNLQRKSATNTGLPESWSVLKQYSGCCKLSQSRSHSFRLLAQPSKNKKDWCGLL